MSRTAAIVVGSKIEFLHWGRRRVPLLCHASGRANNGGSIRAEPIRTWTATAPLTPLPMKPRSVRRRVVRAGTVPQLDARGRLGPLPDTLDDDLDQPVVEPAWIWSRLVPSGSVIDRRNAP